MASFSKFQNYRINLDKVVAYKLILTEDRKKYNWDRITFYCQGIRGSMKVYYCSVDDRETIIRDINYLDSFFGVKTKGEERLLP